MMTRSDLEAFIWRYWPTRGTESERAVTAILGAADAYAATRMRRAARRRLAPGWRYRAIRRIKFHHTSDTDLHELIGVLAEALLSRETERAA